MLISQPNRYQPDHFLHLMYDGAEEMLGSEQLQRVLDFSMPAQGSALPAGPDDLEYARLPGALEQMYGVVGGRGLAQRIGRSMFKYLLLCKGDDLGLTAAEFYLQRAPQRAESGLHLLAQHLASESHDQISIVEEERHWVWRSAFCPICKGRQTDAPGCYLTVGLIQEFMAWTGAGRFYRVVERECRSMGAATCSFWIDKTPLD